MTNSAAVLIEYLVESFVQGIAKVISRARKFAIGRPQCVVDRAIDDLIVCCRRKVNCSEKLRSHNWQLPRFVQERLHFGGRSGRMRRDAPTNSVCIVLGDVEVLPDPLLKRLRGASDPKAALANQAPLLASFLGTDNVPLPNWNADTNHEGCDASDCLDPRSPLLRSELRPRMAICGDRPSNQNSRAERHNRDNSPISIAPSLLHGFPLFVAGILPLEVRA